MLDFKRKYKPPISSEWSAGRVVTTEHQPSRPYKRKIHRQDGVWTYRITDGIVAIRSPNGTKTIKADHFSFWGDNDYSGYEKAHNKRYFHIAPADIGSFLDKCLA